MKVIAISNHGDETVADRLIKDKLTKEQANKIVEDYNAKVTKHSDWWYVTVSDDYRLSRGLEDLI